MNESAEHRLDMMYRHRLISQFVAHLKARQPAQANRLLQQLESSGSKPVSPLAENGMRILFLQAIALKHYHECEYSLASEKLAHSLVLTECLYHDGFQDSVLVAVEQHLNLLRVRAAANDKWGMFRHAIDILDFLHSGRQHGSFMHANFAEEVARTDYRRADFSYTDQVLIKVFAVQDPGFGAKFLAALARSAQYWCDSPMKRFLQLIERIRSGDSVSSFEASPITAFPLDELPPSMRYLVAFALSRTTKIAQDDDRHTLLRAWASRLPVAAPLSQSLPNLKSIFLMGEQVG
jgi:hypothetical protein